MMSKQLYTDWPYLTEIFTETEISHSQETCFPHIGLLCPTVFNYKDTYYCDSDHPEYNNFEHLKRHPCFTDFRDETNHEPALLVGRLKSRMWKKGTFLA